MTLHATKLATEALSLPETDRAFLAHKLIASLERKSDINVKSAWIKEVDKRSSDISSNTVVCRDSAKVVNRIRAKLHATRTAASLR